MQPRFVCSREFLPGLQTAPTPAMKQHRRLPNPLTILGLLLLVMNGGRADAAPAPMFQEKWRPQFHFTPVDTWMNDPNGMVFYEGEYHLFYQNNPFGNRWGHMSWGHAVSRDLVKWEHLPLALAEEDGVMIFSGSAVVDWKNSSGFGKEGRPPLVAIYTGHHTKKPLQNQQIAYSNDKGRTWTKYIHNPVLDLNMADFRDPKVMWHEPTSRWVMTVALPKEAKVHFYASPNLKQWNYVGEFGGVGATNGLWECPDLFPLAVEKEPSGDRRSKNRDRRWVLVVNINPGGPAGGSGCQYFVGDFDGQRFVADPSTHSKTSVPLWADWGRDFYAAVSWSDIPKRDGRRLWLGWMSNWDYANEVPTLPWRSAMTVPRELVLRQTPSGLRLLQRPVSELARLRDGRSALRRSTVADANAFLSRLSVPTGLAELELRLDQIPASGVLTLVFRHGRSGESRIEADFTAGALRLDRTRSSRCDFSPAFCGVHTAPLRVINGTLDLKVLLDTSSVEVFAQGGESVVTDLVLPESTNLEMSLAWTGDSGSARVASLSLWSLRSSTPVLKGSMP